MIVFDLKCRDDHVFEAWFADSATYESQVAAREVQCPICGDTKVAKAPMAPNVAVRKRDVRPQAPETPGSHRSHRSPKPEAAKESEPAKQMAEAMRALHAVREVVEKHFDHVGERFPEEARKIHHGEVEKRNIYGDATPEETRSLLEEGIEIGQVPWLPRHDA